MYSKPFLSKATAVLSRAVPRRIRPVHALLLVIIISVVFLSRPNHHAKKSSPLPNIYTYTDGKTSRPWSELLLPNRVPPETAWLNEVVESAGLPRDVRYYSVRIKPQLNDTRPTVSHVDAPFMFGGFRGIRSDHEGLRLQAEHTIPVPIAPGTPMAEVNAGPLLFGISTSFARVTRDDDAIITDWTRWLTNGDGKTNGASLVLTLRQADDRQVEIVKEKLEKAGIDALVSGEDAEDSPTRYLDLIRQLTVRTNAKGFENSADKKYLAVLDDDTFFPDVAELLKRLEKFDANEEHYIGLPSERADWVADPDETVTFGGGAVFFTPPAAVKVSQLPCLGTGGADDDGTNGTSSAEQDNQRLGYTSQWDHLLYDCVSNYTQLTMHVLPSFYLPSDEKFGSYFFDYDLGIAPLALHRTRNRHLLDPGKATAISPLLNPQTFLQRYRFSDDWVLVNGHTLSHYPRGSSTAALGSPAVHKDDYENRYKKMKPLNSNLAIEEEGRDPRGWDVVTWAGSRRIWNLIEARRDLEKNEVWHAYARRKGDPGEFTDRRRNEDRAGSDYVIVLIWEGLEKEE